MLQWAHVMGATTDWGAEADNVHSNYESYVNTRTSSYVDNYNSYLVYDGSLANLSAYNAAINLAYDSTFDQGGIYTCVWMNNSYSISYPTYWNRAGESLNLGANAVAMSFIHFILTLMLNQRPLKRLHPRLQHHQHQLRALSPTPTATDRYSN